MSDFGAIVYKEMQRHGVLDSLKEIAQGLGVTVHDVWSAAAESLPEQTPVGDVEQIPLNSVNNTERIIREDEELAKRDFPAFRAMMGEQFRALGGEIVPREEDFDLWPD